MRRWNPHGDWRRDCLLIALVFGVLYLGTLGFRPLANPDEGRYSEIPREMLASGDWVLPRLNGTLYFYKPPLAYWLHASAMAVGGNHLWALRFWPAVISLGGLLGVYGFGRAVYGRLTGWASTAILGTSLLFFGLSQVITLDPYVSVFMTLALLAWCLALRAPSGWGRRWLFAGFYLGISLAVMAKGFMAIAIPGAIIFLWFLLLNQWHRLRDVHLGLGVIIFLVVAGPWHIAAAWSHPEWFDFYVVHEHWERYLSDVSDRTQPFWYYLVLLPIAFLPWTVLLPAALRDFGPAAWRVRSENAEAWFLFIWAAFVVGFFSLSQSKLPTYILPAMPPLALLAGRALASKIEAGKWMALRPALLALAGLFALLAFALPGLAWARADELDPGAAWWILLPAVVCAVAAVAVGARAVRREEARALVAAFAGAFALLLLFNPLAAQFQQPGTRAFAEFLKPRLLPGDRVFHFADYFQDFPFYLEQPVDLLFQVPNEQSFGLAWESELAGRYIAGEAVPTLWNGQARCFALAHEDALEAFHILYPDSPVYVWKIDRHFVLFANRPPSTPRP